MLSIRHVKKAFGRNAVLKDLNLEVPEGTIFGFIGKNGAGKTTTMKMILGLLKPDGGEIYVNDELVTYGQNKTNHYIGYLPDVPEFYAYMNAAEYLRMCGKITGMGKREIEERIAELLHLVGLTGEKKRIGSFSRGMKQRLGIAQALLHKPKVLLLDEPTSALDPVGRKEILDLLLKVRSQTTIVFSTHILSDVERICDRIAVLQEGSIVMQGTLNEIKAAHTKHGIEIAFASVKEKERFLNEEEVRELLNSPRVNREETGDQEVVLLHTGNGALLLRKIYEICLLRDYQPNRIAKEEMTVESLFMEAIRK